MDHDTPTFLTMAPNEAGESQLCCITKRRYLVDDGRCHVAPEAAPLIDDLVDDEGDPRVMARDADIYPLKPRCDVVVRGHAWNPGDEARFAAAVQVGAAGKIVSVIGERRIEGGGERLAFSAPSPVESVPLHAGAAYGGLDTVAESRNPHPLAEMFAQMSEEEREQNRPAPIHAYPRNGVGRGYVIAGDEESLAACRLPLLEDPEDLLTPERLVVGRPEAWPGQPLPAYLGWMDPTWFPRQCCFGLRDVCDEPEVWPEVARGLVAAEHCRPPEPIRGTHRASNGAPLELRFDKLRGSERIVLTNCRQGHPRWAFQLPGERPRFDVRLAGGGRAKGTPVMQTVDIAPDEGVVEVVWRLAVPADRPYLPDELEQWPVEVRW